MCRCGFRFSAEPKRWIRVTAPVRHRERTFESDIHIVRESLAEAVKDGHCQFGLTRVAQNLCLPKQQTGIARLVDESFLDQFERRTEVTSFQRGVDAR